MTDAELLALVPTIKIGRARTTHSYRVDIRDNCVVLLTRCDIDLTDVEHVVTHGVISCVPCAAAWDAVHIDRPTQESA